MCLYSDFLTQKEKSVLFDNSCCNVEVTYSKIFTENIRTVVLTITYRE